ncbi:MAG: tetratricopeptide repeat protein, partial [Sedimentisphaerales bacterium]
VSAWRDAQGGRVLVAWQTRLTEARKNDTSGNIAEAQFVEVEANIVNELGQRIRKEISFHEGLFELADIIKTKQAQCLGYSQLVYILGYSLNLPVRVIDVLELHSSEPLPSRFSHVACLVNLADGRSIMVDLVPGGFISRPFTLEEEFAKVGNYWELKDESNPLKIHRRIQIRDRNGLIAHVHDNRGNVYTDSGQFDKALSEYAKAIELNPTYAEAYNNRGGVYADLGQFDRAISERTRAIELDPKFDRAYYHRGLAWYKSGQVAKAVSDYTVALGINPRLVEAYNNRGVAFGSLGQLDRAVLDFTKAVKVDPAHTEAYKNRGLAYFKLNQFTMAISDYTKALELDPELAEVYKNRGTAYGRLGRFDKAILDYSKAIDLDPKYAGAYYYRGLAQAFMENQDKAKQDLLKAVELDPSLKKPVKKISDNFKLNLPLD